MLTLMGIKLLRARVKKLGAKGDAEVNKIIQSCYDELKVLMQKRFP